MSETEVTTEAQVVDTDNLDTFADDFFGRKSEAEPSTTKDDVEQEQEAEVTEAQTDETDQDETEEDEVVAEEPAPKKKSAQDRIDELVRQREDAKREAAAEIAKLREDFEAKLNALKPKADTPKAAEEPDPLELKEDGTEKYPLGEFDPQYIKDLTRFTLNQERERAAAEAEVQKRASQEEAERQVMVNEWNKKVEDSLELYPDFQEKGQTLLNGFANLEPGYAQYLSAVFMTMDKGPDVLYYLSNHPDEAVKIVNSGAQKATLALGRIEAKFLEADAQKLVAKPKVSKAPPPPTVRSRGTNGAFIAVEPDTDDLDSFETAFFAKKK